MRNVKVTYIPNDTKEVKEGILTNVVQVHENVRASHLIIEIDDSNKDNDTKFLSELVNSSIKSISLLNKNDEIDIVFDEYTTMRSPIRTYYDANNEDINKLQLIFLIGR